jgi:hypothetical protein
MMTTTLSSRANLLEAITIFMLMYLNLAMWVLGP